MIRSPIISPIRVGGPVKSPIWTPDSQIIFASNGLVSPLTVDSGVKYIDVQSDLIDIQEYGVAYNEDTDTYTRVGDLALYGNSATHGDALLPIHDSIRRCVVSDAGVVQYYLDPNDSTKKADGSASVLDGTDGQVMIEIPKFYSSYDYTGSTHTWKIRKTQKTGYSVDPAFVKNGVEVDARYIGAYEGYFDGGGKLCSISGVTPTTSNTRAQFRAAAALRGSGWHQYDATLHGLLQRLFLVEYADLNTQAMIGAGLTDWAGGTWSSYNGYSPINATGLSNGNGNGTHSVSNGDGTLGSYMTFRGIENWYGHLWKFADGINVHNSTANRSRVFLCSNPADFADDTEANYTLVGLAAENDGYGSHPIQSGRLLYPRQVAGSSAAGLCDYHYTQYDNNSESGWRMCLVGGAAFHGAPAGAFSWNSSYGSVISDSAFGGRLCF